MTGCQAPENEKFQIITLRHISRIGPEDIRQNRGQEPHPHF